eukprot:1142751-Pelagomonas_calceolata.AAC.2
MHSAPSATYASCSVQGEQLRHAPFKGFHTPSVLILPFRRLLRRERSTSGSSWQVVELAY